MENYQERLDFLKDSLEKAKTARTRAEANLEQLEKQREDIVGQMAQLGVTPDTIEGTIQDLEMEIQNLIASAEKMIPEGF